MHLFSGSAYLDVMCDVYPVLKSCHPSTCLLPWKAYGHLLGRHGDPGLLTHVPRAVARHYSTFLSPGYGFFLPLATEDSKRTSHSVITYVVGQLQDIPRFVHHESRSCNLSRWMDSYCLVEPHPRGLIGHQPVIRTNLVNNNLGTT